jgi:2,4-dienoyl-CoA reductase-like NADH-dependent reductase (Old Yellow Enzyme family)/NADPH-dependent 2,4-dienoyl-CoA reductase/sulfur reductase-like enzyme
MLDSLFSPITINNRQLRNRCIVPAMVMNLCEEDGGCTERFAAYHEAKAKGGFAMIITEDFAITNVAGKGHKYIGGLWKDEHIPGFKEYTDRLHKWGALSIVQLHHPGRQIGVIDADTPWAPSAIPCPFSPDMMPHEMTQAEIKLVVKQFGQAAARAKAAGFDGCELHGAHGYLIEEFMSPYSNKRTDEYGGDLCNRMRFALEIIHEVREQTGSDFIIGYKLSSDEWVSGGLTIEDTKAYVPFLEEAGVDYFGVSVGVYRSGDQIIPSMYTEHGWIANNAKEVKSVASVPVYAIGRINDTRVANAIIKSGKADMVAMGRQSIADPETPNKAKAGCFTDIRTCVGCLHGCDANVNLEKSGTCELNPIIGHESEAEYQTVMTESPKKVLVIGAGPAGLEAAIGAAKCGHSVTVYDKDRWAGGKYRLASVPPCKGELGAFIVWQMHELKKLNVPVILNTEVTKKLVDSVKPDVVIAATGTNPVVPKMIPGYDKDIVVLGTDVLSGKANTGHNVVVIGGGHAGAETANHIASYMKNVTIVELQEDIAMDEVDTPRNALLADLKKNKVRVCASTSVQEIKDHSVVVSGKYNEEIECDTVVISIGHKPNTVLADELKAAGYDVRVIGDAVSVGLVGPAVRAGYLEGRRI